MVVTGDITQIDLPNGRRSGLLDAVEILKGVEGISFVQFDERDVVRHSLVQRIVRAYEKYNEGVAGRQLSLRLSDGIPLDLPQRPSSRTRRHPLRPRPKRATQMKSDPLITYRRKPATLDAESLQSFAEVLRDRVARGREFHCRITNDAELQSLNAQFRGKDYPTDVLSFPVHADSDCRRMSLGDIAISLERARAQAREWQPLRRRRNPHPHAARPPASSRHGPRNRLRPDEAQPKHAGAENSGSPPA